MAIAEVSIVPLGTGSPSVSQYVAEAISVLQEEKDVKYELTSMGTIIEGDLDGIFRVIRRMHETPFDKGVMRVVTSIKIDDRRDKPLTMQGKVKSVKKNLKA
ncbi:MAG: MTH1187 family thiamine-binding protein [Chloroflexi bacterium]|nr:MTH1187 family thiamine-binding protein [Chloroflexota bacterium]